MERRLIRRWAASKLPLSCWLKPRQKGYPHKQRLPYPPDMTPDLLLTEVCPQAMGFLRPEFEKASCATNGWLLFMGTCYQEVAYHALEIMVSSNQGLPDPGFPVARDMAHFATQTTNSPPPQKKKKLLVEGRGRNKKKEN